MASDRNFEGVPATTIASHVLVIESNTNDAGEIQAVLENAGHRVSLAKDGGQAQAVFAMRHPDFIVLEAILPGASGFEICESFKQQNRDVPVLFYSEIELQDARDLADRVGADGYLVKPSAPELLIGEIARIAENTWRRTHVEGRTAGQPRVKFTCSCGKKFRVSPEHRGRALSCPGCGDSLIVPHHD